MTEPIGLLLHVENFSKTQEEALDTGQAGGQGLYTTSDIEDLKMETSYDLNMANPNPFQELRISKDEGLSFIKANFGKISQRQIAREIGLGKTTVNRWSREIGLVFKKHTVNETFFDEFIGEELNFRNNIFLSYMQRSLLLNTIIKFRCYNEASAYLLGLIYADGNIAWDPKKGYQALTITASEKDKYHLEDMRTLLTCTKPLLYSAKTKSYRLIAHNKEICKKLMRLGVFPRKSLTVEFPQIPEEHLNHFLRGVIDGDGSVNYFKRKRSPYFSIRVYSGSEKFLRQLVSKVKKALNIDGNVRKLAENVYGVDYTCARGKSLGHYIYSNARIFLERKYLPYKENVLEAEK
ncbi:LAGLIDADG family homing endonuclease [Candidatus Woesearchaeota archaeon]|nr:LAGLIDADG family homing endonuclease [Candidatus Woesearchaeota archaeon]